MNKKYCPELTTMSGLAIVFVLMIHAVGSCHSILCPDVASYANCGFLLCVLCNIVSPAVPMFIFISGYKYALNDSETPYFTFLKKRLPRVLMSFLILNTLFWALDCLSWMDTFDPILLLKIYIASWMGNSVAYQLWYIPMYCCVLIACTLICKVIKKSWIRLAGYLVIGTAHRVIAAFLPVLNDYPFRFIMYPVFFEMGIAAYEYDLASKLKRKSVYLFAYWLVIMLLSWLTPNLSKSSGIQYFLYYQVGTMVYYYLSIVLKENRVLQWFGKFSYPLFLLHEPVIGRLTGRVLQRVGITAPLLYVVSWYGIVLLGAFIIIKLFKLCKFDKLIWNYRLDGTEKVDQKV